ncbi:MAG: hypothetical protein HUJ53_02215 [Holdemanella sp.]|nr:hypothetical protein [Holdemanella sp.]
MLVELVKKCTNHASKRKIWIPMLITIIWLCYAGIYILYRNTIFTSFFPLAMVFTVLCIILWESFVYIGLFPTNTMHKELFEASTIAAKITDEDYNTIYSSKYAINVPVGLMIQSEEKELLIDKDTKMKNEKILNGHFLWFEDISYMNSLLEKSKSLQDKLEDENELLKAEASLRTREETVKAKSSIYNQISVELKDQINYISDVLETEKEDIALKKAAIVGAYIKRKANLILLSHSSYHIDASELGLCFRESLHILEAVGIEQGSILKCNGTIHVSSAKIVYDFFEDVLEKCMDSLESIFVNLYVNESIISLKIVMDGDIDLFEMDEFLYQTKDFETDIQIKKDDSLYVSFITTDGGDIE